MVTLSPAAICTPLTSTSRVAVRRMYTTGDAHRTISSTAVLLWASKSFHQISRCSG